jgi:alkylated DNA nucleotide flippase Atl1
VERAFVANSLVFLLGGGVALGTLLRLGTLIALGGIPTLLGRAAGADGVGRAVASLAGLSPLPWRRVLFSGVLRAAQVVVVGIALMAATRDDAKMTGG